MTMVPILIASGLGVALLAGLTSGARASTRATPGKEGGRRRRRRRRPAARRTRSSKPSKSRAPRPPKPKAKRARSRAKPKPKAATTLDKEFTITATEAEPIQPHRVRVEPAQPPKPRSTGLSPRDAAQRLYDYARGLLRADRGGELGTKGRPSETVRHYQKAMGKIRADGQYGPKTRARGKELLGRTFPVRKRATAPAEVVPAPPKPAEPTAEPASVTTAPAEMVRTPKEAAQDLFDYAKQAPKKAGRGEWFGTKTKPNPIVAAAQRNMGGLKDDGIYGPKTRRRGRALLGRPFPTR